MFCVGCAVVAPDAERAQEVPSDRCDQSIETGESSFTVATFNIHGGRGPDDLLDLSRTAAVIYGVDFAGLQEVTQWNLADGLQDQPAILAELLGLDKTGMLGVEDRALWDGGGKFGNAYATGLTVIDSKVFVIPGVQNKPQRYLGWVRTLADNRIVDFFVTHLTNITSEPDDADGLQLTQVNALIEHIETIRQKDNNPCILMGDFNAGPGSPAIAAITEVFEPALSQPSADSTNTADRIDYIFITNEFEVITACLVENNASDHPAVLAVLQFNDIVD